VGESERQHAISNVLPTLSEEGSGNSLHTFKRKRQTMKEKIEIYIYSLFVRKEEFERVLKRATKHKEKFKREGCRNTIQKTGITLVFFCAHKQRIA
jgi:hypothetical protein